MSASKTYQCLSCRLKGVVEPLASSTRQFSTSARRQKKSPFKSFTHTEVKRLVAKLEQRVERSRPYTPREKQLLALKYTPEQIAAIEEGEETIQSPQLWAANRRTDGMRIKYLEDFSKVRPLVDKPIRAPTEDIDPNIRERTEEEILMQIQKMHNKMSAKMDAEEAREAATKRGQEVDHILSGPLGERLRDPNLTPEERREIYLELNQLEDGVDPNVEFKRMVADPNTLLHSPKGTLDSQSDVLAPTIPKFKSENIYYPDEEEDPALARLSLQTGLSREDIRRLRVKTLVAHRVVNQTRMGKIQSQYFLTIAGNEKGMVGVGEGKAAEEEDGRRQAMMAAIRNMKPVPRYEDRTIYGEVTGKVGASVVQLSARPPGFGNRCQHLIYELARAAGIQDLAARTPRSRNPMNVVKAAWEALTSQTLPEDVARARGRKLVDVRKVYYGGQV
ncbi:hypothetical protein K431DRAFT_294208 [Polychaeton citri CBS 116435]|uniref:Small ribosomal subunit protein uS5m n=1 Tax=Polychaeton citri CBS 116435 TaxID=1314669 RepID=A0A9P4QB29_9PEZI|nr:hypothetical protein K431DRAFT_294208 [Polychaeton citri CBS 116435]